MAKRISEDKKKKIIENFIDGKSINQLSEEFGFSKVTISRNLKKNLGDKYKKFLEKHKDKNQTNDSFSNNREVVKQLNNNNLNSSNSNEKDFNALKKTNEFDSDNLFMEIPLLNLEINEESQKDFASTPLDSVVFPKVVYMVVDDKIELEVKLLKDYPEWQFLSKEELNRKTIEIFYDIKIAKSSCKKEQKVIKVPNTDVFRIVAPLLKSRGISRIVSSEKLIVI